MDQNESTYLRLKLISKWIEELYTKLMHNPTNSSEITNDKEEDSGDAENSSVKNQNDDVCRGKKIIFIITVINYFF